MLSLSSGRSDETEYSLPLFDIRAKHERKYQLRTGGGEKTAGD